MGLSRKARSRNLYIPVMAAVAAVSLGYYLYSKYSAKSEDSHTPDSSATKGTGSGSGSAKKNSSRDIKVSIVISHSLISQGVPISQLLHDYPELVFVLMPGISKESLQMTHHSFPKSALYRIIPCDTEVGTSYVLKHLESQLVVLPYDYPSAYINDLKRFVGKLVILSDDLEKSNNQFKDLFFD